MSDIDEALKLIAGGDPKKAGPGDKKNPETGIPVDAQQRKLYNTTDEGNVFLGDMMNYSIVNGKNPMMTKQGRTMFQLARALHGDKAAHELVNQIVVYGQRADQKSKSNTDKISSFYEIVHGSPELEKLKSKVSAFGLGPEAQYLESPNLDVQETTPPKTEVATTK